MSTEESEQLQTGVRYSLCECVLKEQESYRVEETLASMKRMSDLVFHNDAAGLKEVFTGLPVFSQADFKINEHKFFGTIKELAGLISRAVMMIPVCSVHRADGIRFEQDPSGSIVTKVYDKTATWSRIMGRELMMFIKIFAEDALFQQNAETYFDGDMAILLPDVDRLAEQGAICLVWYCVKLRELFGDGPQVASKKLQRIERFFASRLFRKNALGSPSRGYTPTPAQMRGTD